MEEECCEGDYRGEEEEENPTPESLFAKIYKKYQINVEDLPVYKKNKIAYSKENPAFLVAWIEDHLNNLF